MYRESSLVNPVQPRWAQVREGAEEGSCGGLGHGGATERSLRNPGCASSKARAGRRPSLNSSLWCRKGNVKERENTLTFQNKAPGALGRANIG